MQHSNVNLFAQSSCFRSKMTKKHFLLLFSTVSKIFNGSCTFQTSWITTIKGRNIIYSYFFSARKHIVLSVSASIVYCLFIGQVILLLGFISARWGVVAISSPLYAVLLSQRPHPFDKINGNVGSLSLSDNEFISTYKNTSRVRGEWTPDINKPGSAVL